MQLSGRTVLGYAVALLALASVGAVDDASAQNLVLNPGFETGDLTHWEVYGQTPNSDVFVQSDDNGPSEPGTHNAFMDNHAEGLGLTLKQSTPPGSAAPGPVFYSFDLKLGEQANSGVFFVEVFAEQEGGGVIGSSGLMGNYDPADWTAYEGAFEAPDGTDFLTIQFMANTGAVEGAVSSMHVDNVNLNCGATPTKSLSWGSTKALYR